MDCKPGSLSCSMYNDGRFLYCKLKEAVDVFCNREDAQMFLNIIKKSYDTKEKRNYLQALLTIEQWKDLKRLVEIVRSDKFETNFSWNSKTDLINTFKSELSKNEKETAELLYKKREPLLKALGVSKIDDIKPEDEFGEFGRVDLMVKADRIGFPIEIKDETANERLSGQILKYIRGTIVMMKYGGFDTVQGVVIAPNYSREAISQLKNYNVLVLKIILMKESYRLERVV